MKRMMSEKSQAEPEESVALNGIHRQQSEVSQSQSHGGRSSSGHKRRGSIHVIREGRKQRDSR